ncbi:Tyrosine-protein kinase etk [compost metagenome]|uniref:LPS O-antigen chain length determinant protein WzzB n=1 Tax=Pseudomonas sp. JUb96 TaxID=2940539 RepID=UPI000FB9C5FB|nr:Wzz/FepE/Etk N-terminal domain-containing protein [Pseudomonas sp. JUb96]MCW2270307.1 chain length determinant protein (polysaccharide antigen chain regulator) [Pseudomonas sp. JUb96]
MQGKSGVASTGNEIDLIELVREIWSRKIFVVLAVVLGALVGLAYVLLVTPVYEAKGLVIPPTQNGIAELNNGRTKETDLAPYKVSEVYGVFTRNLRSETLRRRFFEEQYLPSLSAEERNKSQNSLYGEFSRALTVALIDKNDPDRYSVIARYPDPEFAEKWVRLYIEQAGLIAKAEVINNAERESQVRAKNLAQQIKTLRDTGRQGREDSIIRLREALRIANAIGLREPPLITGRLSAEVSAGMGGDLTYMRGSKALEAEIKNLEERQSNDPFIGNLRALQVSYAFYKNLVVEPEQVSVFRFDGPVEVSDAPVKPKRVMSVVGGAFVGLIVGLLVAGGFYLLSRRTV